MCEEFSGDRTLDPAELLNEVSALTGAVIVDQAAPSPLPNALEAGAALISRSAANCPSDYVLPVDARRGNYLADIQHQAAEQRERKKNQRLADACPPESARGFMIGNQPRPVDPSIRLAYGQELRQQAEDDRKRRKMQEITSENQPILGGPTQVFCTGGEPRHVDVSVSRAYAEDLRRQVAADQERRKLKLLADKPQWIDRPAVIDELGRDCSHVAASGADQEPQNYRAEEAKARIAYGKELRQQAAEDEQRRRRKPLADKPEWQNPTHDTRPPGLLAAELRSRVEDTAVPVDQLIKDASHQKQTDDQRRRAYGEDLRRQAADDERRRKEQPLTDKPQWRRLQPSPGFKPQRLSNHYAGDEDRAGNIAAEECFGGPDIAGQGPSLDELMQAERDGKYAYGQELLLQVEDNERPRLAVLAPHEAEVVMHQRGGTRLTDALAVQAGAATPRSGVLRPPAGQMVRRGAGKEPQSARKSALFACAASSMGVANNGHDNALVDNNHNEGADGPKRAYLEELLRQAEADKLRRREKPLTDKPQWVIHPLEVYKLAAA